MIITNLLFRIGHHQGQCNLGQRATNSLWVCKLNKKEKGVLGKPSLKKNIFLLTFVNKDFTPQVFLDLNGETRGKNNAL